MQPALRCFDGVGTLTVFHFHDRVIVARVDDFFINDFGMGDIIHQCPADAAAAACVDEAVLGTGIEGILAADKLGVKHHVALLALALEVGQAFPGLEVTGAGNAGSSRGSAQVARASVIMAFSAKDAVDPAVFMSREAHVIDVGGGNHIIGHRDGLGPESEVVHAVWTLGHSEERLAVGAFNPHNKYIFALPFDGACIERRVHHDALHQVGVVLLVEVILPLQGHMLSSDNRVLILLINAVPPLLWFVLPAQQRLMMSTQGC